jgi:enoyl-CoA hydratase/carnithine racemase
VGASVVHVAVVDGVATITLDSPANRNALGRALLADLAVALDRATAPDVRVVVLTHTGPAFCAGADLKERSSGTSDAVPPDSRPPDSAPMVDAMARLMDADAPTIASVKGPVRAGGIGLMASCDLVVVAASVDFAFTEVRIGVAPAIISVPILGRANASLLRAPFLTGERFDAQRARSIGLVTHVGSDSDDVDRIVAELCAGVLAGAPHAVAETKRLMRTVPSLGRDVAFERMRALSDSLFQGADAAEGMAAFLEKRRPAWHTEPRSPGT